MTNAPIQFAPVADPDNLRDEWAVARNKSADADFALAKVVHALAKGVSCEDFKRMSREKALLTVAAAEALIQEHTIFIKLCDAGHETFWPAHMTERLNSEK